ncbi:LysR substrate-binding domain-containing protein [Pelistega europaea]|uniref:LysR family transcriptional regulator n=1 Tax=Pelistega europaea TaxID=106147 RepID=A0A7Y4L8V1_9BURK|nr:LysR substrate-binding domain-containing protein [Pelistega europaea]NOL49100.1 LysR family transcriptional regulator [Pelistega europaea]
MTLVELKYVIAVARERHFGRAAEACFVSQPTLSVGIKKLEEELGVSIFERGGTEISVTPIGHRIVEQAQKILEASAHLKELAKQGQDPLAGALRVGVIHTIGPYLLPKLVRKQLELFPQMPLILQENFTANLLELLRLGELDCAIMALPIPETGLEIIPLYHEEFIAAVPLHHRWANAKCIHTEDLKQETMLLLGKGHCFRDQVLEVCPEMARFSSSEEGMQRSFEGSSLETIRHMVAAGLGITLLPQSAVPEDLQTDDNSFVRYIPLSKPVPSREVVLVWRRSFTRQPAIDALVDVVKSCGLPGVKIINNP